MKMILLTLSVALFCGFKSPEMVINTEQFTGEERFAIFLVPALQNQTRADLAYQQLSLKNGINTLRTDHFSQKVFVVYDSDASIDEAKFREWFQEMGMEIKCYSGGQMGVDPIQHPSMDTCDE